MPRIHGNRTNLTNRLIFDRRMKKKKKKCSSWNIWIILLIQFHGAHNMTFSELSLKALLTDYILTNLYLTFQ